MCSYFDSYGDTVPEIRPICYQYTVENGLNSNFITDLFNDSKGLLWIGTQNGMNTFDGRQFKSVDFNNVSESFVTKTAQAPDGVIWFSTLDGLLYHINDYVAIPHPLNDSIIKSTSYGFIPMNLTIDSTGTIYSSGSSLVMEITPQQLKIIDQTITPKKNKNTTSFKVYNNVLMGISFEGDPTHFSRRNQSIHFFDDTIQTPDIPQFQKVGRQYSANTLKSFAISRAKELMVFMNHQFKIIPIDTYSSNSLYFENDTILWVGTQGKGVLKIVNQKIIQSLLPNERVHAVIKDFEGGYWVGSEKGLHYYPNLSTTPFFVRNEKDLFLSIGSYQNKLVGVIKPATLFRGKAFKELSLENQFRYIELVPTSDAEMSHVYKEHSLYQTPAIDLINWETLNLTPLAAGRRFIYTHQLDSFKYSYSELQYYRKGKLIPILNQKNPIRRVKQIVPDSKPHQYFVTHLNGVLQLKLDHQKNTLKILHSFSSSRQVKNLFYLGNFIVVTSDDDFLHTLNFKTTQLDKVQSIPREDTRTVYELNAMQVLLGTASGLKLLSIKDSNDINSIQLRDITNEQGLAPLQVNKIEVINDTIYTLSESGIICYPLSLLGVPKISKGKISINQFLVNGKEIVSNEKIFNDQTLLFHISTVSFKDRDHYLPQFRLLPLNEIGQALYDSKLSFYNLPANKYTLQIQDQYGQLVQYSFVVNDYYYEKWWFILLMTLLVSSLLFTPIYIKNKYKAAEAKLEAEKDNWRLKTLTSQLKPHFIFNALSSIQAFILKNDARSSSEFLSKFSMYIRNALEQTRTETFSLSKALSAAKTYLELEQMRLNGEFDFEIKTNGIATEQYSIPVMLLQPYVENAVVHGITSIDYQGKITIEITKKGLKEVCIQICDNGKGLKNSSHKGHGIGTSVNEERVKLINAKNQNRFEVIIQDNPEAKGVCVLIKIHLKDEKD